MTRSKLAKNSTLYLLSTLSIKAAAFILLPFYTHLITPEQYGTIYVINAFITFMSLFLSFSMSSAIQRFYFDCVSKDDIKYLYSTIVIFVGGIASLITAIMVIFESSISVFLSLPQGYLYWGIFAAFLSVFYPLILSLLYAKQDGKKISITMLILGILQVAIQLALVLNLEDKIFALIFSLFINSFITFILFIIYSIPYFMFTFNMKRSLIFIKYSLHQLPSDISVWLISFSDRILLNKIQGAHDTGVYGIGSTLGQIPQIVFHSVNKAYVPYVFQSYKTYEKGEGKLDNLVKTTTILVSIITVLVSILICFSNNIISIFSTDYADSGTVMALILFAFLIDAYRIIFMNPISYNIKFVKFKSAVWIFSAILSISLNLFLIPKYSIYGACASLLISYSITFVMILYFSNKAIKINYEIRKIIVIFIVSVCYMFSVLLGYSLPAFILKILISLIYLLIILKILDISLKKIKNFKKYV